MELATNKPRVFVSSTIHDFKDLRSALKYWLQAFGIDVRMSEFHDFTRQPDEGTYDSCFNAIKDCDYYILLIGSYKGSPYQNGVSVTQQEYRTAVKLAEEDWIVPIVFIRQDVLTAVKERETLAKVASLGLETVTAASSRALFDAEFVCEFVSEVRTTEVKRKGEDPSGYMWTYPFSQFSELVDALRTNLRLFGSLPRRTLLANFQQELYANIATFCSKVRGNIDCGFHGIEALRAELSITTENARGAILLNYGQAARLQIFLVLGAPLDDRIQSSALRDAIASGEFLSYSPAEARLVSSPELSVMYELNTQIQNYRSVRSYLRGRHQEMFIELEAARFASRRAAVLGIDLANVYALARTMVNILRLSFSLLDFISDPAQEVQMPQLAENKLLGDESPDPANERATREDIERWRTDLGQRNFIQNL
ncbi:MAG: DUF4062 domain-containing protein [Chloroflexota bacterium]|nr:DUF4062 domain-containing protein [Chloroflexota bacterium]